MFYFVLLTGGLGILAFLGSPRRSLLYVIFTIVALIFTVVYKDWFYLTFIRQGLVESSYPSTAQVLASYEWILPDIFSCFIPPSAFLVLHIIYQILWRPSPVVAEVGCGQRIFQGLIGSLCGIVFSASLMLSLYNFDYISVRVGPSGGDNATRQLVYDQSLKQIMQITVNGMDFIMRPWALEDNFTLIDPSVAIQYGILIPSYPAPWAG